MKLPKKKFYLLKDKKLRLIEFKRKHITKNYLHWLNSSKEIKYSRFIKKFKNFKIYLDDKSSMQNLVASAKYVFGLESNVLFISLRAGKKVFTILPLNNKKFRLPFKKIKNINKFNKF